MMDADLVLLSAARQKADIRAGTYMCAGPAPLHMDSLSSSRSFPVSLAVGIMEYEPRRVIHK
jgi:hypothetical protein